MANPYEGMTDEQVLAKAAEALRKVQAHPVGSIQRSIQWSIYEAAKAELDIRMLRYVLKKIRDREA